MPRSIACAGRHLEYAGRHYTRPRNHSALHDGAARGYSRPACQSGSGDEQEQCQEARIEEIARGRKRRKSRAGRAWHHGWSLRETSAERRGSTSSASTSTRIAVPSSTRSAAGWKRASLPSRARRPCSSRRLRACLPWKPRSSGRTASSAGAREGTVVIEASTLPLETKLDVRDRCAAHKITVLDCPISGTGAQAAVKDISVYASGPEDAVARCRACLRGLRAQHALLRRFRQRFQAQVHRESARDDTQPGCRRSDRARRNVRDWTSISCTRSSGTAQAPPACSKCARRS